MMRHESKGRIRPAEAVGERSDVLVHDLREHPVGDRGRKRETETKRMREGWRRGEDLLDSFLSQLKTTCRRHTPR
jgi:hypothetical protein